MPEHLSHIRQHIISKPHALCVCLRYRTAVEEVPKGHYTIPLGKAKVKREGTDITLVGWGQQVAVLEKAVSSLHPWPLCSLSLMLMF